MMLEKVFNYAASNHMIERGDRIIVGVSGGADSVCLLHVLHKLYQEMDVTLIAVHVNHGIRGEEADRDEQYVKELCQSYGIRFHRVMEDVRKIALEQGLSEEEAGRNVRYEAFLKIGKTEKCNKIAVAHNKNDNAETVLFHLFRGTGIKGLTGTPPCRKLTTDTGEMMLIRPLLCAERREIEAYLKSESILYQIDSTNLTEDYSRNKIRNRILQYAVEEINSGAVGNICDSAAKLEEVWEYIDSQVELRFQTIVSHTGDFYEIPVRELMQEPAVLQKGILRRIMEKLAGSLKDLESGHVDAVLSLIQKQVGKCIHLPYGILAERGYDQIKMYLAADLKDCVEQEQRMEPVSVRIPGQTIITQKRKKFETEIIKYEKNEPIPKSSCMKWFDYDKIENAVVIRQRREGDVIQVNASGGRKKLKDYFIDQKIPQKQRDSQLLITDGSHVMWIPGAGERMSEKYKVDTATKNVLLMKMFDLEEENDDTQG